MKKKKGSEVKYDGHLGPLNQDLRGMNYGQLEGLVVQLRAAIRADRDASGHKLCWYRPELWDLLPEKVEPKPKVPPTKEFIERCRLFRKSLDNTGA